MSIMRLVAVAAFASLAAGSASAAPAFHPAQSAAEQTLAHILKLDAAPDAMIDPAIEGRPGTRPPLTPPAKAPYMKYLTSALATAILLAEAKQVKANCHGVYRRGDECGMDADPIICAQDFPDSYLFRTTAPGAAVTTVDAAWPPDQGAQPSVSGHYRLALVGGAWKIDGIACSAGDSYNWKGR